VSLVALVGDDHHVLEAHNEAVTAALRYLEATTAQARIKQDGQTTIETTGNWVIARFNHDTSRELDPQLHTHAVVINATRRADGEWRTLSSKEMFRAKMLGGAIYRAELARGLQRLGYEVEVSHRDGRFEVKDSPENSSGTSPAGGKRSKRRSRKRAPPEPRQAPHWPFTRVPGKDRSTALRSMRTGRRGRRSRGSNSGK
jgi:conjugative relaxase-like TrwC/TraI family protein